VIHAFAYLIRTSTRNRLASQARRLRQPVYALAAVCGLAYFWFVYFRRDASGRAGAPVFSPEIGAFVPLLILLYLAWAWVFGADKTALAFTPAEVSFLFPAPVTRRQLIWFKLARGQVQILLTATLWVALFHKGAETLSPVLRVVGFVIFLSTLNLHRLGVALAHSSSTEHGWRGVRRHALPITVLGGIAAATAWGLWPAVAAAWAMPGVRGGVRLVSLALQTGPVSMALWPIRATISVAFAANAAEWVQALPAALAILVANLVWVARADHAFEESAAEASAIQARKLAAMRARRSGGVTHAVDVKTNRTIPLAPRGSPWVAIVWKNVMSLMRSGGLRTLLWPGVITVSVAIGFSERSEVTAKMLVAFVPFLAVMLAFFAPMFTRNDLRTDLLHLPMLKTLPLSGRQIVLAQILGGALPVALGQALLVVAAVIANGNTGTDKAVALWLMSGFAIASPVVLVALNAANFAIHNGIALLFPAWIRLGSGGPGGVETMGLGILTFLAVAVALLLLLIVPAAVGAGAYFGMGAHQAAGLVVGLVLGSVVLSGELWLLTTALGRAFERVEPTQVA
jgi:ABC-2 type transport system permease protein